jgi:hypothetical protein
MGDWVSVAVEYFPGDPTGTIDIGPALQAALDATPVIDMRPKGRYLMQTPVFDDRADRAVKSRIELNGATLLPGANLPVASGATSLAGARYMFFNNTRRTALGAGVVTTDESTSATAALLAAGPRMVVSGGTVDGTGQLAGVIYGNHAPSRLEDLILRNLQVGLSWVGYVDMNSAENVQTNGASPAGGVPTRLILQRDSGDQTRAVGCKAFGGVVLDLAGCFGFYAEGPVSGQFILNGCEGVIVAGHEETDEISTTPYSIFLDRTELLLQQERTNAGKGASHPSIYVLDDNTDPVDATVLTLDGFHEVFYLRPSSPPDATDTGRGAAVHIEHLNPNGRVRWQRCRGSVVNGWAGSARLNPEGLLFDSADPAVSKALAAGADAIADGNGELKQRRSGIWVVDALTALQPVRHLKAPTLAVSADTSTMPGSGAGSRTFRAALKTGSGRYTALSGAVTAAAGATGGWQLDLSNVTGPATVAIWYKAGGDPAAGADGYVEVPFPAGASATSWWDEGTHVNGRSYQTGAGIPVPNNVAASSSVISTTKEAPGAIAATFSRETLATGSTVLTSTVVHSAIVEVKQAEQLTKLGFHLGGTAAAGLTHSWLSLQDLADNVLAVTADGAIPAATTNADVEVAVTAPIIVAPGFYVLSISATGTTMPNVMTSSGASSAASGVQGAILTGNSPDSPGAPPAVGARVRKPTAATGMLPYLWGSNQ